MDAAVGTALMVACLIILAVGIGALYAQDRRNDRDGDL